jgi:hypothetical protein
LVFKSKTRSIEQSNLDKRTTYNLIASHGRVEEFLAYATLIGDYEKVISHWVQEKDYNNALDVLSKQVRYTEWLFMEKFCIPSRKNYFANILVLKKKFVHRLLLICSINSHQY